MKNDWLSEVEARLAAAPLFHLFSTEELLGGACRDLAKAIAVIKEMRACLVRVQYLNAAQGNLTAVFIVQECLERAQKIGEG